MQLIRMPRWISVILSLGIVACSSGPTDSGLCSLNCSDAVIGANTFKFEAVRDTVNVACQSDALDKKQVTSEPAASPVIFLFRIVEEITSGGTTRKIPRGSIRFDPSIFGVFDTTKSDRTVFTEDSDKRYLGITTKKDQWCSDTCGVAALEVWPQCLYNKTNEISVQLVSGSLASNLQRAQVVHTAPDEGN